MRMSSHPQKTHVQRSDLDHSQFHFHDNKLSPFMISRRITWLSVIRVKCGLKENQKQKRQSKLLGREEIQKRIPPSHCSPEKTPKALEEQVLVLRQCYCDWGAQAGHVAGPAGDPVARRQHPSHPAAALSEFIR